MDEGEGAPRPAASGRKSDGQAPAVDFSTNCYENDWQIVLGRNYLRGVVDRCAHDFARRRVLINNVKTRPRVEAAARAAVARGDIDEYIFSEDHADAALALLKLDRASLDRAYYYSIAELVSVYLTQADYLLHYKGDCYPKQRGEWIGPALQLLEARGDLVVANLCWNDHFEMAKAESFGEEGDFFVSTAFLTNASSRRCRCFARRSTTKHIPKRIDAFLFTRASPSRSAVKRTCVITTLSG